MSGRTSEHRAEQWRLIKKGSRVVAGNGDVGRVETVVRSPETDALHELIVRADPTRALVRVPAEAISYVANDGTARLSMDRTEFFGLAQAAKAADEAAQSDDLPRIPILEERLAVRVEPADLGEVRVNIGVEQRDYVAEYPRRHDEVEVVRTPMNVRSDSYPQPYQDGDWQVIPVVQEELVVSKVFIVVEEVRLRTRSVEEMQTVKATLRRTRVDVEGAGQSTASSTTDVDNA
jgi:uncharacterized protein (TIGR02271 family)